jgi:hypothetical protein
MNAPSAEDLRAAEELLGRPMGTGIAIREWKIEYEGIPPSAKSYFVEEWPDTVYGGTYLHCNCTGWRFQKGKGLDCKHVAFIKCALNNEPCVESHGTMMATSISTHHPRERTL